MEQTPRSGNERQSVLGHDASVESLLHASCGAFGLRKVIGELTADEFGAGISSHATHLLVYVGDDSHRIDCDQSVDGALNQSTVVGLLLAKLLLEFLLFRNVTSGRKNALEFSGLVIKRRGVITDDRLPALP